MVHNIKNEGSDLLVITYRIILNICMLSLEDLVELSINK